MRASPFFLLFFLLCRLPNVQASPKVTKAPPPNRAPTDSEIDFGIRRLLLNFEESIKTNNTELLSTILDPKFAIYNCTRKYEFNQVIGFMRLFTKNFELSFDLTESYFYAGNDYASSALLIVQLVRQSRNRNIEVFINWNNFTMRYAKTSSCRQYPLHLRKHFGIGPDGHLIAEKMVFDLETVLETRNSVQLSDMLEDNFNFDGCGDMIYDKNRTLWYFQRLPSDFRVTFSASTMHSRRSGVLYMDLRIRESRILLPSSDFSSYLLRTGLYASPKNNTLNYGISYSCFHERPKLGDYGRKFWTELLFLKLEEGIETKNMTQMRQLLDKKFIFSDCQQNYTRGRVIRYLRRSTQTLEVSFEIKSIQYEDVGFARVIVNATGFNFKSDIEFIVNWINSIIVSGKNDHCGKNDLSLDKKVIEFNIHKLLLHLEEAIQNFSGA